MPLWRAFFRALQPLRAAVTRQVTFYWLCFLVAMFAIRTEHLGVTSCLRAGGLAPRYYHALLHFFRSTAVHLERLTQLWTAQVRHLFRPVEVDGYLVCVADGLKVPREGRKMPATKSLHTESANNSKPPYIMGHSFQVIALLVHAGATAVRAVPLVARICEGVVFTNRDRRSLLDKLVQLGRPLWAVWDQRVLLIADAYYGARAILRPLLAAGHQVLVRARRTAVAYHPAEPPTRRGRGRPKVYGAKVVLQALFTTRAAEFRDALSPVYGEQGVTLRYLACDLLWRPAGCLVRFVLVDHPLRGRLMLLCTHTGLEPLTIIQLYGYRYKIESMFKQAIHVLGVYAYHFWMLMMTPLRRGDGNQHLHRASDTYRAQVRAKLEAYHRFVQLGCIAQGLLIYLAVAHTDTVWRHFRSWLRTIRPGVPPSELVVQLALRQSFPEFLLTTPDDEPFKKFLAERSDPSQNSALTMAA